MSWRDALVAQLTGSLRIEPATVRGALKLSMAWPKGDIDMPEVCNHLARHFKMPSVTVIRRTLPGRNNPDGGRSAVLRISGLTDKEVAEMQLTLNRDLRGLAQAIVSSGT